MYDFSQINALERIDSNYILSRIDQATLWTYYYGNFKLGKAYSSRFRPDTTPSTIFYINQRGNITLKDFTNEERLDIFNFIAKSYGLDFKGALNKIAEDFGFKKHRSRVPKQVFLNAEQISLEQKKETKIQFEPEKWDKKNSLFFREGTISIGELEAQPIYPTKRLFLNKKEIYSNGHIRYAIPLTYTDQQGKEVTGVKIYSPSDTKMKWLSNIPLFYPWGIDRLKFDSPKCAILKSPKDSIIAKRYFSNVISLQNESIGAFPPELRQWIKKYFAEPFIIFGADPHAVRVCKIFNKEGFGYFNTPKKDYEEFGIEDPFDFTKQYGDEKLKQLFQQKGFL